MSGSPARKPTRESGQVGHHNAAFEPDTYIEPVMNDGSQRYTKAPATHNGGRVNPAFRMSDEYDEPAVIQVNVDSDGYAGLDKQHTYQDLKPNGDSNPRSSHTNGHASRAHTYVYGGPSNGAQGSGVDTGVEVHEYDYPEHGPGVNTISGSTAHRDAQPYGFNRQESYKFKGNTEQERTKKKASGKKSSHWSRICAVFVAILILLIIGAIIFVVFEFIVNKSDEAVTTTQESTTATLPVQMYLVTTTAVASLDLDYTPALADSSSAEYQELETNFTLLMDTSFQNSEIPGVTYEGVIVNSFSPGSVVVNFDVVATATSNSTSSGQDPQQEVITAVETGVNAVLTDLTQDNSSDLPVMGFNLTGSSAEIIASSTPESTTAQKPTQTTRATGIETTLMTTSVQETTINPVTTETPTTPVPPSSTPATPISFTTPTQSTDTDVSTGTIATTATPSATQTTPSITYSVTYIVTEIATSSVTDMLSTTTATPSSTMTTSIPVSTSPISTTSFSGCQADEVLCTDGVGCVRLDQFCDGVQQCLDGSDETFCTGVNCTATELQCADLLECYPISKHCDNETDCSDGSDETSCSFCPEFTCNDGIECYPFSGYCDGNADCTDGSDELLCSSCPELTCNDGIECYPFTGYCDGNAECTDGSDEAFCSTCPESTCNDGIECYPFTGYCDGNADCIDGSDEAFCSTCPESTCDDGIECYPFAGYCDGNPDCTDGSDEACTTCPIGEVPCNNGLECYDIIEYCNGNQDCSDGSDELFCTNECSVDELACATGNQCYNASYKCDGIQDCRDQSDELNCTSELIVIDLSTISTPYYLSSPNYPNKYPLNTNQSWLFIASSGYSPRADISDLYTEPNRDFLSFYSGSSPVGQALALSGALTRSGIISYRASGENLYVTFTSDNAVSVRGFSAAVTQEVTSATLCDSSQYNCNDGIVCMPADKSCSCPVPPVGCNTPTDCFSCDSGKCIPFDEECDGQNQCEFGEDERNCMQGCDSFLCNDGICVANSTVCDTVNDCTGGEDEIGCTYPVGEQTEYLYFGNPPFPLTSYGYPAEYPDNVDYQWTFIASGNYKIRIQFDIFSTHDANDYVIIGDGDVIGANPFLRLYGGGFVPQDILSLGNQVWITMVTDREYQSIGFYANVTAVLDNEVLGACAPADMRCGDQVCIPAERLCDVIPHCVLPDFNPGCPVQIILGGVMEQYQAVTSPFVTLYSANYPNRYDDNINSTVYLTAPAGQYILAATREIDVEEEYDYLWLYEGHSTNDNNLITRITGLLPNQVFQSIGNQMTVVFQSDYAYSLYGFWIEVEGKSPDGCASGEYPCMNGQCRPADYVCDGEIDCIDFSDEDKCPSCQAVPSACSSVLSWSTTVFPNGRYQTESEALQRYNELESAALSCSPTSGQLLLCAALFPECPHYGPTRNLCPSVCSTVMGDCPALAELSDACSGSTVLDQNNGNPICEARNGDSFDTLVCGTRPAYQGDSEVQPRIIGGTFAEMGEFPWIGSLRTSGDLQCGATLLNEYWAVTAAHCTGAYDEIVFGDLKTDTPSNYSVSPTIAQLIDHPNYFSTSGGDDITLIRFAEPVVFNDYVRPICLPTNTSETQMYRRCYAAGWGTIVYEAYASNELQKVLLGLLENDVCGKSYHDIIPSKICAGYAEGGFDACQGDSGGPLACEGDDGRWHLVGIVSYGNLGCGDPGFPGVYTRVSSFLDFIHTNIGT